MAKKLWFLSVIIVSMLLAACGGGNSESANTTETNTETANTGTGSSEETINLKIANITQPVHSWNQSLEVFEESLQEQADGKFNLELFPGGQLGNEADMLQQLDQGNIDMMVITTAQLSEVSESFASWLMPFIVDTHEQAYDLWMSEESMNLFDSLSSYNVKGLGYLSSGFRWYLMRDEAIKLPDDLDRKSLRITPSPAKVEYYRALNVSPTPMPLTEVYTSLQQGVIDGVDIDSESIIPERLYETGKHLTPSNHIYWQGAILINSELWETLTEEDQEVINSAVTAAMNHNVEYLATSEAENLEKLTNEPGMSLYELDREAFQPFVDAIHENYAGKNSDIAAFLEKAAEIRGQ
ncbi:TRAP transporter substrate-binding protein [Alkalihalobacterium alkalinitrilicum]|uniref:TRAP transporter substrate-binding protein n=1 Tax=Alkalihalobacterium alkalinitrilicum TaxID=427920 RepID=UPI000994C1E2|nr:TRAP transporter substrate-binding protein [Alkalihalobacterium alkalinitrilicum]